MTPITWAVDLILNGGFESYTGGASSPTVPGKVNEDGIFPLSDGISMTNWTNHGLAALYSPGTADLPSSPLFLSGPNNTVPVNNGMTATSPAGGNFFSSDGWFMRGALEQTVNGLTPGSNYTLSFYWAAAQQYGYSAASTDWWTVDFGGQTQDTPKILVAAQGFAPWTSVSMDFTATSASQLLSFTPFGSVDVPPFLLLDGVSMVTSVPEPSSIITTALAGLLGVGEFFRRRVRSNRRKANSASSV